MYDRIRGRRRLASSRAGLLLLLLGIAACGGSGVGPSPTPRVSSITPNTGSIAGGTQVTIVGTNFAAGASVTIGGTPATQVTVVDATTITATTAPHAVGGADVVVTVNGQSASLPNGYAFVGPAPTISSISVQGVKPREPAQFADLDEAVTVSASVTDPAVPTSQLTFAWSADAGAFSGTGAVVTWTAPHTFVTPATITLTLTVTGGGSSATGTTTLRLHDSVKEVGDLAVDFLTAFSQQLNVDYVMRNFTSSCSGTANERSDVQHAEQIDTITAYSVGAPDTTVGFTGRCPFRNVVGDACAQVPASWTATVKLAGSWGAVGDSGTVTGTDQVTAVLENDEWRLCASDWSETSSTWPNHEQQFSWSH